MCRLTRQSRRTTTSSDILGTRTTATYLLEAPLAVRPIATSYAFFSAPGNVELADNEIPVGEASLIAMKGSLLGLGTDIGM